MRNRCACQLASYFAQRRVGRRARWASRRRESGTGSGRRAAGCHWPGFAAAAAATRPATRVSPSSSLPVAVPLPLCGQSRWRRPSRGRGRDALTATATVRELSGSDPSCGPAVSRPPPPRRAAPVFKLARASRCEPRCLPVAAQPSSLRLAASRIGRPIRLSALVPLRGRRLSAPSLLLTIVCTGRRSGRGHPVAAGTARPSERGGWGGVGRVGGRARGVADQRRSDERKRKTKEKQNKEKKKKKKSEGLKTDRGGGGSGRRDDRGRTHAHRHNRAEGTEKRLHCAGRPGPIASLWLRSSTRRRRRTSLADFLRFLLLPLPRGPCACCTRPAAMQWWQTVQGESIA